MKGKIRITRVGSTYSLYESDKDGNWMLIFDNTNLDGDFDVRFHKELVWWKKWMWWEGEEDD